MPKSFYFDHENRLKSEYYLINEKDDDEDQGDSND